MDQHNLARRIPSSAAPAAAATPAKRVSRRRSPPAARAPHSGTTSASSGAERTPEYDAFDALEVFESSVWGRADLGLDDLLALDCAKAAPAAPNAALPLPPSSLRPVSFHVKLPHGGPPPELNASVSLLLSSLGVPPAALTACVRPGCVLLTLDALTPAAEAAVHALQPEALLAALAAAPGPTGAYIRSQAAVTVRVGDAEAAASPVAEAAAWATQRRPRVGDAEAAASLTGLIITRSRVAAAPRPPPLAQLALLCTSDGVLSAAPHAPPLAGPLACRLGAHVLPCALAADGRALLLPASGLEGALLVEHVPEGAPLHRAGAARPVLLTRDAAVAAEVAAALGRADRDDAERALLICGAALRPDAAVAVLAPAAALAARLNMPALLTRISVALRERCVAGGAAFEPHFLQLLAAAVVARAHAAHGALLAAHADAAAGATLASSLLRAARREGHALLPCALMEASELLNASAEPSPGVLRAASAVLAAIAASAAADDAAYDSADEAEGAAADAAMEALQAGGFGLAQGGDKAGFIAFMCDANLDAWRTIALLSLLVRTVHAWLYWTYMRGEPGPEALLARGMWIRKQVHGLRFYDPADLAAPSMTAIDYPWATVLAAAPRYMAWSVLVLIPVHIVILLVACLSRLRPFVRRHYEPLFASLLFLKLITYIFMDAFILHVSARVPRYAFADCVMHALGILFFFSNGMFGLRLTLATVLLRFVGCVGICVWTHAWGMLLWPENVMQLASLALSLVLTPRRQRRLRAQYFAAAAAAALPAAKPKTA